MSAAHTPGPWVAHELPDGCYAVDSQAWKIDFEKHGEACDGHSIQVYGKQAAADARLIAAAPELLAALQRAEYYLLNATERHSDFPDTLRDVSAAIAKAVQS